MALYDGSHGEGPTERLHKLLWALNKNFGGLYGAWVAPPHTHPHPWPAIHGNPRPSPLVVRGWEMRVHSMWLVLASARWLHTMSVCSHPLLSSAPCTLQSLRAHCPVCPDLSSLYSATLWALELMSRTQTACQLSIQPLPLFLANFLQERLSSGKDPTSTPLTPKLQPGSGRTEGGGRRCQGVTFTCDKSEANCTNFSSAMSLTPGTDGLHLGISKGQPK